MKNIFYLPINSNNLGNYFSRALIVPQNYIADTNEDIQSLVPDYLVFTEKKFYDSSDCIIEIVLNEKETSQLKKIKNVNLFGNGLPVTRIKKVHFHSKEKMERTLDLARSSAFIPDRLIKLSKEIPVEPNPDLKALKNISNQKNIISEKISDFDKFLGGMAFMRLGGENYMNYSKNYFSTLSFFNRAIKDQVDKIKNNLCLTEKYQDFFSKNESDINELKKIIYNNYEYIIRQIGENVLIRNNVYQQNTTNNFYYYVLAILANYGEEPYKPKSIDSLIQAIISNQIKYRETITLIFGLHNGYRPFKKLYFLNDKHYIVKFELNSKLDFYTIESIYQYAFYNNLNNDHFDYLSDILPVSEDNIDKDLYKTYQVLDKEIIYNINPALINHYENKVKYLKEIIEKFKDDYNHLLLLLKEKDKNLFNEIDTNNDGELSWEEIRAFIEKVIKAKNIYDSDKSETLEYSPPPTSKDIIEGQKFDINLTDIQYYLNILTNKQIGKIAKQYKLVKNIKDINTENREKYIENIIRNIKQRLF